MHQDVGTTSAPGSVGLSDHQRAAVSADLREQRRFRIEQLEELKADAAEAVATTDDPRRQVAAVLTFAAESALEEIDAALRRLDDGSYGICQTCTEPISWERLEILPNSRLCTPCQSLCERGRSHPARSWPVLEAK